MAGTGKSTISRTIATTFTNKKVLSASFFFKRGEGDRGNASRFFTTIAAHLATRLPQLVPHIASALGADPLIVEKSLDHQCNKLILEPLSASWQNPSAAHGKVIILIDALDGCEEERHIQTILKLLSRFRSVKGIDMRIFVTSRPERPIRLGFQKIDSDVHKDVALHAIPERIVDHDLRAVLASELGQIREEHSIQPPWPTRDELDTLVSITRPLFIHAATVCRFVSQRRLGNPRLLERILMFGSKSSTSKLRATYYPVLHQLVAGLDKEGRNMIIPKFRQIVGTIVALIEPLPKAAIANLVNMSTLDVDGILNYLHSVLRVPADGKLPVQLFHLSFHDYLVDNDQCDADFLIDEDAAHSRVAIRCIEIMSVRGLRENICGLEYPGKPRDKVSSDIVETCLPAELQYACRHWVAHMQQGRRSIRDDDETDKFLRKHFLHLLEALGLLGRISEVVDMIAKLQCLLDANDSTQCSVLLSDARRFVLAYRAAIDLAPLQVYAMVVFAPEESSLKRVFESQIPYWIRQVYGIPPQWTSQLQVLEGHSRSVYTIAYSPDGKQLASVSEDMAVHIWDATTGQSLGTVGEQSDWVENITYSPDGKQLAWSSDNEIYIRDVATGILQWKLTGRSNVIAAIAYSQDGTQLISSSHNMTVQIWDARTGTLLRSREGHRNSAGNIVYSSDGKLAASLSRMEVRIWDVLTGELHLTIKVDCVRIYHLALSVDGMQVALGLSDQTVQIWDLATGVLQHTLDEHKDYVSAISFSPDGRKIASGSWDCKVRIFDVLTGALLQTHEGHIGRVFAVAFSPDSRQVASGAEDETVRIWDVTTKVLPQTSKAHDYAVQSLAYSPNGKEVASGSRDGRVCIWDEVTGAVRFMFDGHKPVCGLAYSQDGKQLAWGIWRQTQVVKNNARLCILKGHDLPVYSIAFSPNGEQLVSGSGDKTVRIWDIVEGTLQQTLKGHTGLVRATAYSPDSTQIVSSSVDRTVQIWDVATGTLVRRFEGRRDSIMATAFSPDGKQVVSASEDETVRIWDAATGALLRIFEGRNCRLRTINYSPCGSYLVTNCGTIYLNGTETPADMADLMANSMQLCSKILITAEWLLLDGLNMLWLPPDFRATCSAVHGSSVTLGCQWSQVVFMKLRV